MVKMPSSRLQHFLAQFTLLPVEGSSETGFFRHLSNQLFPSPLFLKYIAYDGHLFYEKVQNLSCFLCLGPFTMLLVEGSSETEFFKHSSNYLFRVRNFRNTSRMRVVFFLKNFKISCRYQKCRGKMRKTLFFLT